MTKEDKANMSLTTYYRDLLNDVRLDNLFRHGTVDLYDLTSTSVSHRFEEKDNNLLLSIDLPGVRPDCIEINALGKVITINYDLRGKKLSQKYTVYEKYDANNASAKIENGVLELKIPSVSSPIGKKIELLVK